MRFIVWAMTVFAFSMTCFADEGTSGLQGRPGEGGAAGAGGKLVLSGLKCVISTNLEHLRMCLEDKVPVNARRGSGESIFQVAIESRDIPMLQTIIENPDQNNKPDLRVRFTRMIPASPGLNTYELLLYGRAFKNRNWEPVQVDAEQLTNMLYVDDDQVAQLKLILAIETDKTALEQETREILVHLKNSKYLSVPSVQDAIKEITAALTN